jgi:hypothetical protein
VSPVNPSPTWKGAETTRRKLANVQFRLVGLIVYVLGTALLCRSSSAREIALYSPSQWEIIRVSYAAAAPISSQTELDELAELSLQMVDLKYASSRPVHLPIVSESFSPHKRGESSMALFHRRLPSRYNYSYSAALQTGYGQLFPASRLGQSRTDGAGPEDAGFFYLKMCLWF